MHDILTGCKTKQGQIDTHAMRTKIGKLLNK